LTEGALPLPSSIFILLSGGLSSSLSLSLIPPSSLSLWKWILVRALTVLAALSTLCARLVTWLKEAREPLGLLPLAEMEAEAEEVRLVEGNGRVACFMDLDAILAHPSSKGSWFKF
jgi:hypothetical protein